MNRGDLTAMLREILADALTRRHARTILARDHGIQPPIPNAERLALSGAISGG